MKKNNKIIISLILVGLVFLGCFGGWYFGYHKPHKDKIETCENLAVGGFMGAFGDLESVYEICKNNQLQKLYAETKRKEGIEGASLEAHQEVYALCECASKELAKSVIRGWVDKCVADDEQWIVDSLNAKKRFENEPESFGMLIEMAYKMCKSRQ